MHNVHSDYLLPRGVWRAPSLSPDGETCLYAVDHNHRWLRDGCRYILPGDNPYPVAEALWDLLNEQDPVPQESFDLPSAG